MGDGHLRHLRMPRLAWCVELRGTPPGENDLGATLYFGLPYYARWATVAAKMLINKGLITPDELTAKIDEVRARMENT